MESMKEVPCLICESVGQWESADQYMPRENMGAHICKSCGFMTYDSILKNEEMKEFYRKEYRPAPNVNNEYTTERKLHYHNAFLDDVFIGWIEKKKTAPKVFESGAAYGRLLNFIKMNFKEAEVRGTELTLSMRRVAAHEFGIRLDEDFTPDKYDLIVSYKVAEHIPFVDTELKKYGECLTDDGHLYIGVPIWFRRLHPFGLSNFTFADYYHPNHVNMWSREHFQYFLARCGFRIIKADYIMYDDAYLCVKDDELVKTLEVPRQYEQNMEIVDRIKKASDFHDAMKFNDAFKTWPDFPDAHIKYYEMNRAQFDQDGFETIEAFLQQALQCCPESTRIMLFVAGIYMRYEKFQSAIDLLNQVNALQPNNPLVLESLGNCLRDAGQLSESYKVMQHLRMVSTQYRPQAITWAYHDAALIPSPWEEGQKNG